MPRDNEIADTSLESVLHDSLEAVRGTTNALLALSVVMLKPLRDVAKDNIAIKNYVSTAQSFLKGTRRELPLLEKDSLLAAIDTVQADVKQPTRTDDDTAAVARDDSKAMEHGQLRALGQLADDAVEIVRRLKEIKARLPILMGSIAFIRDSLPRQWKETLTSLLDYPSDTCHNIVTERMEPKKKEQHKDLANLLKTLSPDALREQLAALSLDQREFIGSCLNRKPAEQDSQSSGVHRDGADGDWTEGVPLPPAQASPDDTRALVKSDTQRLRTRMGRPIAMEDAEETIARVANETEPSIESRVLAVRARMRKAAVESGLTIQEIGERMGYDPQNARQRVSELLNLKKYRDAQISTLILFSNAVERSTVTFLPIA